MKNQKKINYFFPKANPRLSQNNSFFTSVQMKYIPQQSDDEDLNQSVVFNSFAILGTEKKLKIFVNEEPQDLQNIQQEPCNQNDQSQFTQTTLMRKNDIQFSPSIQKKKQIQKKQRDKGNSKINHMLARVKPGEKVSVFSKTGSKINRIRQVPITKFVSKKKRKMQLSKFFQLSKHVVLKTMMYLGLKENIKLGMTCFQLNQNYKFIWFYGDYFKNLDSQNFTPKEIDFIRQKCKGLHSKVLNLLLQGRQTSPFLKKTSLKLVILNDQCNEIGLKPNKNGQAVQIYDHNINTILREKSIKLSIQQVSLEYCCFLTNVFDEFSNLSNLHNLIVTHNLYIKDNQIYQITKNCKFLKQINLSFCKKLSEQTLTHILTNCKFLETLNIRGINNIFEDFNSFYLFKNPTFLQKLNISNIQLSVQDIEQIIQHCKILNLIKIQKNQKLTLEQKEYLVMKYNSIKFIF